MPEIERQNQRLPLQSRVFIEFEAAAAGSSEEAQLAVCKALDVSSTGLRVMLQHELTVDAFLQIGVEPPGVEGEVETFFLAGQVRWCRPSGDQDLPWLAGFALLPAEHSDISRWVALISQLGD